VEEKVAIGDYQRDAGHAFIDNGADLVLGHGPMAAKGIEIYKGKAIFYSLGKFLLKGPVPTGKVPLGLSTPMGDEARRGIAAMVTIADKKISQVAFAPSFGDDTARPQFIPASHEKFGEITENIRNVSKATGLASTFTVAGNRVIVS
jgi:poly-gamma-glutamate synthesis protein (capsule biosynthesis protein)